jgi:hypothetical protein
LLSECIHTTLSEVELGERMGGVLMLDVPLQLLIGGVATVLFVRRGDRLWLAAGKGTLVSICLTTVLSVILAITAGTDWSKVMRGNHDR